MKNRKTAAQSRLRTDMVKSAGEARVDTVTDTIKLYQVGILVLLSSTRKVKKEII